MSGHLTRQSVELYQQQRLPAKELLEADAHLSTCASCREQLLVRAGTSAAIKEFRAGLELEDGRATGHPAYEQFTAYAAGRLAEVELEIMDSHLSVCAQCADVMSDLRAFVAIPAASPMEDNKGAAQRTPSFTDRFAALWHSLRASWTMPMQFAGAAAALLLLAGISAGLWYAFTRPSSGTEVVHVTPRTEGAPTPQPTQTTVNTQSGPEGISNTNSNTNRQNGLPQTAPPQNARPQTANGPGAGVEPPTVALKDGDRFVTIDAGGNVSGLETLSARDQQVVRKALATEKVEAPSALASLAGSVAVLRGGSGEGISFPVLTPLGTVVMSAQPTLRWGKLDGATSYVASIYDRNFRRVAVSQSQTNTEWTVSTPLARGQVYTWQVTATRDGQEITSPETPAPEAKFMILEAAKTEEIRRAEQSYRGSHLTLGTLYARAGLLDEAEREFQMLLRDNPKSNVARKLLDSVRALRNAK